GERCVFANGWGERTRQGCVWIIGAGAEGRWRGGQPASKTSMITMRQAQCGQGWSRFGRTVSSQVPLCTCSAGGGGAGCGGAAVRSRARASLSARLVPPFEGQPSWGDEGDDVWRALS